MMADAFRSAVTMALLSPGFEHRTTDEKIEHICGMIRDHGLAVVPAEDILAALTETDALYSDCAAALRRAALPATGETE